ncbi:unnamed protein product [Chrysoparadoxa australica]
MSSYQSINPSLERERRSKDSKSSRKPPWALLALVLPLGLVAFLVYGVMTDTLHLGGSDGEGNYSPDAIKKLRKKEREKALLSPSDECFQPALELSHEHKVSALLEELDGVTKFEASEIVMGDDGMLYAICDSSWDVYRFDPNLPQKSQHNVAIRPPYDREGEGESSYEAFFIDSSSSVAYAVREAETSSESEDYYAIVEELKMPPLGVKDPTYEILDQCVVDYPFPSDSKGLEGAIHLHSADGELYLLGLCEGNYCADKSKGRENGNGRVMVLKKQPATAGQECHWAVLRLMNVPMEASFQDYSSIAIRPHTNEVAIVSQEASAVWIGTIGLTPDGYFDPDSTELQVLAPSYTTDQLLKGSLLLFSISIQTN